MNFKGKITIVINLLVRFNHLLCNKIQVVPGNKRDNKQVLNRKKKKSNEGVLNLYFSDIYYLKETLVMNSMFSVICNSHSLDLSDDMLLTKYPSV